MESILKPKLLTMQKFIYVIHIKAKYNSKHMKYNY